MTLPASHPAAQRARDLAVMRGAVSHQLRILATLLGGLADIYERAPTERGLIAYIGGHAERVRQDLAVLVTTERALAEAA